MRLCSRIRCACEHESLVGLLVERAIDNDARVDAIERTAATFTKKQQRLLVLNEREQRGEFDVFLSYNSEDLTEVQQLCLQLREQGILAWMDRGNLTAGDSVINRLETALSSIPVVAVCVGANPLGPWQRKEYESTLHREIEGVKSKSTAPIRIVPVFLKSAQLDVEPPTFLRGLMRIDFRKNVVGTRDDDAFDDLCNAVLKPTKR